MSIIQGTSKAAGGAGYEIEQSIRFNDGDSPYLNRTFGTPTSNSQFGYSFWIKLGEGYNGKYIISANGSGNNDNFYFSSNKINIQEGGVNRLVSNQLFRDFSSWYHFVVAYDLGNATASQKLRVYLNGSEITSWATDTRSSLSSTSSRLNAAVSHDVGANVFNGVSSHINNWDGYIAEFHFVDGGAVLTPTDFGEYNSDGVWIPKAYDGSYGTNGFYITGETASDLGEDFSGNNNDFTSSGLTTTDQMLDTPTDNYAVWQSLYPFSGGTFAEGALNYAGVGDDAVITSIPIYISGKGQVEITENNAASFTHYGLVPVQSVHDGDIKAQSNVYALYGHTGEKITLGSLTSYGDTITAADRVTIYWNNGAVWFAKNGTLQNSATQGEVEAGTTTNAAFTGLSGLFYITVGKDAGSGTHFDATLDTGQSGFVGSLFSGFNALSTASLPTPSITDGSAHFQPTLYTGTGSSLAVTQSGNSTFQPDFVWIKGRSGATEHVLTDAVRGVTKELSSNDTGTEETVAQGLTAFGSSGFTVGTDGSYNTSSATYVGWQWKANGAGSSNTDGDITSTVSANTTAGFSIVKYAGNLSSTGSATIGHGLGIAPSVVISKSMDSTAGDSGAWAVQHTSLAASNILRLNTTAATSSKSGNGTLSSPTSTVFYTNYTEGLNVTGNDYIAYCFAEIPGYSSIGSYTGNGSTDGPFVYTGFKPAFVMFKVSSNAPTGWAIIDNKRSNPFNPTDGLLQPDQTGAEGTSDKWDILSNGFKVRTTWAAVNGNGYTVTYMAFAENPFGGDGAAPATAR